MPSVRNDFESQCIDNDLYDNSSCRNSEYDVVFDSTNVRLRQGVSISPRLFSLFRNDLVEFLSSVFDGLSDITDTYICFVTMMI